MTELHDWQEDLSDVESLVRAAGGYVQASSDLRPRVLENARARCGERRVQRMMRQISLVMVLLTVLTASQRHTWKPLDFSPEAALLGGTSQGDSSFDRATQDVGWNTVDAFTEFRRQQAAALRSSL